MTQRTQLRPIHEQILAALGDATNEMATLAIGRSIGRHVTAKTMAPLERDGLVTGRIIRCGGGLGPCNRARLREGLDPWLPSRVERRWTITDAGRRAL